MKYQLLITVILLSSSITFAQEIPKFEQAPYRDADNKLYWNKHQEVFISLSTTKGGKQENLESEISADYANPFYFDTEGINYMRTKHAVDKTTRKIIYPMREVLWEVYADGLAPRTKSKLVNAKKSVIDGKIIYGGGLKFALQSKDAVSKVKNIYYSLNAAPYTIYNKELNFDKEGENTIKYFAVDNVGNIEKLKQKVFSVDLTPPETSSTISGVKIGEQNIISLKTKIYFTAKDLISSVYKTYYSIDNGKDIIYNGRTIPLNLLKDGEHTLKYYSVDKLGNKEAVQTYAFYLDRTAPITASDVLGDRFIVGDMIYFSGRTKLKLTAVDNKSGVKDVRYSINKSEFEDYEDPFYLPSKQGIHIVRYYATDNTENITTGDESVGFQKFTLNVDKIYVDLTGPSLNHSIYGDKFYARDTVFISPRTKIKLTAKDGESGLQYISYSLDGKQKETEYKAPFSINAKSGLHKVEYFGYDNVNNRNIGQFYIFMDSKGPDVNYKFSIVPSGTKDGLEIYPNYASMFITIQDKLTGVSKIYYSINGAPEVRYKKYIAGFKKNTTNTIKVRALDKLNNVTIMEIKFYTE